ncbi:MAG: hypothetical protein MI919_17380 [Holophagales bacterium]|nr:hypothetical protein [Holophagales bacterium]
MVGRAMELEWTRDPFDRFSVAIARLHRAPLVTKDEPVIRHFEDAVR